jgi:hypothetical protein
MSGFWFVISFFGLLFGVVCSVIWKNKGGNALSGFLVGLLLGIIGLIIVAVADPNKGRGSTSQGGIGQGAVRECPWCKEAMKRDASVCPHCQRESTAWTFHDGRWWTTDAQGEWVFLNELSRDWVKPPPAP